MVRIAGIDLPNKRITYALPYINGIGLSLSRKIVKLIGVNPQKKAEELTPEELRILQQYIEKQLKVEGDLRKEIKDNIKRLITIGSYRGTRHARKLPTKGQRTKTNARTLRGKRKTMTSGKRILTKK